MNFEDAFGLATGHQARNTQRRQFETLADLANDYVPTEITKFVLPPGYTLPTRTEHVPNPFTFALDTNGKLQRVNLDWNRYQLPTPIQVAPPVPFIPPTPAATEVSLSVSVTSAEVSNDDDDCPQQTLKCDETQVCLHDLCTVCNCLLACESFNCVHSRNYRIINKSLYKKVLRRMHKLAHIKIMTRY